MPFFSWVFQFRARLRHFLRTRRRCWRCRNRHYVITTTAFTANSSKFASFFWWLVSQIRLVLSSGCLSTTFENNRSIYCAVLRFFVAFCRYFHLISTKAYSKYYSKYQNRVVINALRSSLLLSHHSDSWWCKDSFSRPLQDVPCLGRLFGCYCSILRSFPACQPTGRINSSFERKRRFGRWFSCLFCR